MRPPWAQPPHGAGDAAAAPWGAGGPRRRQDSRLSAQRKVNETPVSSHTQIQGPALDVGGEPKTPLGHYQAPR